MNHDVVTPTRKMINPHLLQAISKRWHSPRFAGGKFYYAVLVGPGLALRARKIWNRDSQAEEYARRLKARWIRLYDQANPTPPSQD